MRIWLPSLLTESFVPGGKILPSNVMLPSGFLMNLALAGTVKDPSELGTVPDGSLTFPTSKDLSFSVLTETLEVTMAREPSALVTTWVPSGNLLPSTDKVPSWFLVILEFGGKDIDPS